MGTSPRSVRAVAIVVLLILALVLGVAGYALWGVPNAGDVAPAPAATADGSSVEVFSPYGEEITATLFTYREDGSVLSMTGKALPAPGAWKHIGAPGARQRLEFRFTDEAVDVKPASVEVSGGERCYTLRVEAGTLTLQPRDPADRVVMTEALPR